MTASAGTAETVRGFWHGSPLGPYQLLCLRSFADRGHRVEVFAYGDLPGCPDWITRRDAAEIVPGAHVMRYQTGFGRGSPALHSNLFRYVMLHRLGGWWIDLDVLLLRPDLPGEPFFLSRAAKGYDTLNNSAIKMPAGHPMLAEAIHRCRAVPETEAVWGQTGPLLLTELVGRHGLEAHVRSWDATYPVPWLEVPALFDPARRRDVEAMCRPAIFLHLFNEIWRGSGIPRELGPPAGSFLDAAFVRHDPGRRFAERMAFGDVARWIGNRRDKIMAEERLAALESRHHDLEARWRRLEAERDAIPGHPTSRVFATGRRWIGRVRAALPGIGRGPGGGCEPGPAMPSPAPIPPDRTGHS